MPGKHKNRLSTRSNDRIPGQRLTHTERATILSLYSIAHFSKRRIGRELSLAQGTVQYCIQQGFATPKKQIGRKLMLTTQRRKRLILRATLDSFHRRLTLSEIADLEGIRASSRALSRAFEREGYGRRVALKKPFLKPKHIADRLTWAKAHRHWTWREWKRMIWTDECSFKIGPHGRIWVTRRVDERLDNACLAPKFRKYSCIMIHGAVSGEYKGPITLLDESVKAAVYVDKVLPHVYLFLRQVERLERISGYYNDQDTPFNVNDAECVLMEDGASPHTARITQQSHAERQIKRMKWPAQSPDLNPIENVWRLLKYRVGRRFPKTKDEMKQVVLEEWDRLTPSDFAHYVNNMEERVLAVIEAKGGHTKW